MRVNTACVRARKRQRALSFERAREVRASVQWHRVPKIRFRRARFDAVLVQLHDVWVGNGGECAQLVLGVLARITPKPDDFERDLLSGLRVLGGKHAPERALAE